MTPTELQEACLNAAHVTASGGGYPAEVVDAVIRVALEEVATMLRSEATLNAPGPGQGLYIASLMVRSLMPDTEETK